MKSVKVTLLLYFLVLLQAAAGTWEEWIEKDAPFFSTVVDARNVGVKSHYSLLPRALVFPLGQDVYLAYDVDLLRVAAVWQANGAPLKNPSMSVNSYPYEFRKVGSGQRTLPKVNGELWFENAAYPGFSLYPGSNDTGLENLTYKVFEGHHNLPRTLNGKPTLTGKLPFGFIDLDYAPDAADKYSIVFEGQLTVPKSGTYSFTIHSDRKSRFYIDDKQLFEGNDDKQKTVEVKLNKGKHPLKLEFCRSWKLQYIDLLWSGPDFKDRPLSVNRPLVDPRPKQENPKEVGRGGLPEEYGQFLGVNLKEGAAIEYKIDGVTIRENFNLTKNGLVRQFLLTPHKQAVNINLMDSRNFPDKTAADLFEHPDSGTIYKINEQYICRIAPSNKVQRFSILYRKAMKEDSKKPAEGRRWKEKIRVEIPKTNSNDALSVEKIPLPFENENKRAVRGAGIDFFSDGRLALVTFDGDVWIGSGLKKNSKEFLWCRFASGLHEPLGLTIRNDELFVFDRNGLWRLLDRDKDGEADYHNLYCSQIDQTAGTREFAMAVEVEKDGSFIFCQSGLNSGSRSAGALMRVSADGKTVTEIARGLRAPFMGYDPVSGQIAVTDQQGQYVPSTPIIFPQQGAYYGHPSLKADSGLPVSTPMTWVPHQVCASSSSVVWMRDSKMGQLEGQPILLSYNKPKLLQIHTDVDDIISQGGVTELPVGIDSPILNGAVNPVDGLLYLTGFKIYDSSAKDATFLSRIRVNPKKTLPVPLNVRVEKRGLLLTFADTLDRDTALKPESYTVKRWNYKRTPSYGSGNYKLDGSPGTETLNVASVELSRDRKSVFIAVPDMQEVMQIEVAYNIKSSDSAAINNKTYLTAHLLRSLDLRKLGFKDNEVDLKLNGKTEVAEAKVNPSVDKGSKLYTQLGCVACHSIDGSKEGKSGPSWLELYGSKRKLVKSGKEVVADEAYLRESILDPSAKVAVGAVNGDAGMPIFAGVLDEEQIQSLVLYMKSLSSKKEDITKDLPLVYSQDFKDQKSLYDLVYTDPKIWKWGKGDDGIAYIGHSGKQSAYKPKVRSPYNIGIIKSIQVRNFVMDVELKQTGKDYGHRDMCVFFGFKDRSHFYYSHIATKRDAVANNLHIVINKDRQNISKTSNSGHDWKDTWHKVRVIRNVDEGSIKIYVNDMLKPAMTASDKTLEWGHIGFGSFDDEGQIRNIRIWSDQSKKVVLDDVFAEGRK